MYIIRSNYRRTYAHNYIHVTHAYNTQYYEGLYATKKI